MKGCVKVNKLIQLFGIKIQTFISLFQRRPLLPNFNNGLTDIVIKVESSKVENGFFWGGGGY
jgi:hypothetical protein